VLEQARERSVERPIASPEAREGKDALATQFLHQPALGEDDAEDIAKGRQGDEYAEGTLGTWTKNVSEEGGG